MNKKYLIILLCLLSSGAGFAGNDAVKSQLDLANKAYEQNNYGQAINIYESLLNQNGIHNETVYYNLGNCYYRTNKIGKAVLNYEKAAKINPSDDDVQYNLAYLKSIIKDSENTDLISKVYNILTINILIVFTLIFNIIFFSLFGISIYFKELNLRSYIITAGIVFVLTAWWAYNRVQDHNKLYAIVVSTPCDVRSGPGTEQTAGLSLQEGKKVEILGQQENWYAVGVKSEHYKGWLEADKVELVN
ncbi:MAG: hypothetical protein A2252_08595 [Elusimicrobia bacterium RIFOXYA2_FULL_39_19]|nr:MAG: hypothetical protein A2252_08595 [Elusimicrobia bacterium RIFOXYA2_FULL_39_19]